MDGRAAGGDAAVSMNADAHPTPADRITNWDYEADVVIAGYGIAGAAAAVEAASASADVLVLERTGGWGRRLGPWSDRGNASRERIGMVPPRLRSA